MAKTFCVRCMKKIRYRNQAHRLKSGEWCGGVEPPTVHRGVISDQPKVPLKVNPIRADGKRECPICTNSYKALAGEYPVAAHFDYATHRWCPGGKPPTAAQKASRKGRGRSVRTVNGGLPEHGKR